MILIYKKGEKSDPANYRPISLCNTIYKLFTSCLARRLHRWANHEGLISLCQKGYGAGEGCHEHNFILQSVLDNTRRKKKKCAMAWLDISNAFSSVPHNHLYATLQEARMPQEIINLIKNIYSGSTASIRTSEGKTPPIPVQAGVKQGCPLSPLLFNLAIEPIIKTISQQNQGYQIKWSGSQRPSICGRPCRNLQRRGEATATTELNRANSRRHRTRIQTDQVRNTHTGLPR